MSPTNLESKAAYIAHKLSNFRISAVRVLEAMLEWNELEPDEKAKYRLPEDRSWSEDETAILRNLWASGAMPEEVMAALPERSFGAITAKAHREQLLRPAEYRSLIGKETYRMQQQRRR